MRKSGNNWKILYHPTVVKKDIPNLSTLEAKRVRLAIEAKLSTSPVLYGMPLRGSLRQLWKLRVGDWRVVFSIDDHEVKILVIANRKDVYKLASRRVY